MTKIPNIQTLHRDPWTIVNYILVARFTERSCSEEWPKCSERRWPYSSSTLESIEGWCATATYKFYANSNKGHRAERIRGLLPNFTSTLLGWTNGNLNESSQTAALLSRKLTDADVIWAVSDACKRLAPWSVRDLSKIARAQLHYVPVPVSSLLTITSPLGCGFRLETRYVRVFIVKVGLDHWEWLQTVL